MLDILTAFLLLMPPWLKYFTLLQWAAPIIVRLAVRQINSQGPEKLIAVEDVIDRVPPRPVFLIHGTLDNRFRPDHSIRLFEQLKSDAKGAGSRRRTRVLQVLQIMQKKEGPGRVATSVRVLCVGVWVPALVVWAHRAGLAAYGVAPASRSQSCGSCRVHATPRSTTATKWTFRAASSPSWNATCRALAACTTLCMLYQGQAQDQSEG